MKTKSKPVKSVRSAKPFDTTAALALISRHFSANPILTPIADLESKRDANAAALQSAMEKLNQLLSAFLKKEPKLLEMINLCRAGLAGNPYESYFGSNARLAFLSRDRVVIIHRFGYANIENTVSLAILPDNRMGLVENFNASDMEFFYHKEIRSAVAEPVNYNRPLVELLERFTNTGLKGKKEFLGVLLCRIQKILW